MRILDGEALHRDAWSLQHGADGSPSGRDFLFRPEGNGILFRQRGQESLPRKEHLRAKVLLIPIRRFRNKEREVPPREFRIWLAELLSRNGMHLERIEFFEPLQLRIHNGRTRVAVDSIMEITITDYDQANRAYQNGIGRFKAFGCGMLLIVP